jgi:DNA-binding winged helix-turn-helix (wHTH) protein
MEQNITGYRFDDIILDIKNRQILQNGEKVPLNTKYLDVLVYLVEHDNQLVTKEELFERIWSDVIVTDWALSQCIKDIRKVLGDNARSPEFIKTYPKHGFMFLKTAQPLTDLDIQEDKPGQIARRPYKFLDFYRETDSDLFFGRESEIDSLCSKILTHHSLILYGRSGVGKSSIIHAGIVPALKKEGQLVAVLRAFHNPAEDLIEFLRNTTCQNNSADFQILKQALAGKKIILIFDQFEEFFSGPAAELGQNFISLLGELLVFESSTIKMVFVIREDQLAEMNALKSVLPDIFVNEYRLLKLSPAQAARAITEPSRQLNYQMEDSLVTTVLADLSDKDSIDPPQLQIVCDALYDFRNSSSLISLSSYQQLGGAAKILTEYLDRVIQRFDSSENELARSILLSLISEEDQRLVLPKKQLYALLSSDSGASEQLQSVIAHLAEARLIRTLREEGEIWIELTHDFLVPEILRWQSEEMLVLKRMQAIMERALNNYETHQLLMDEETLELVLPLAEQLRLTQIHCELLVQSLLNSSQTLPEWLVSSQVSTSGHIEKAMKHSNPSIRIAALQSAQYLPEADISDGLVHSFLWDDNLQVRKVAGIVLAHKYPQDFMDMVLNSKKQPKPGFMRVSISLSLIRDYDRRLFRLWKLPMLVSLAILSGLIWVRLRRESLQILRETIGGALGAGLAGLLVGISLGTALAYFREIPAYESITLILVLASLGMFASMLAGMGISLGMNSLKVISYRHSPYWKIVGAMLGGAMIGGFLHLVGVDTFLALFGQDLTGIAGAYEGALVGLGMSFGASLGGMNTKNARSLKVLLAAIGAMLAAIILTLIEGNLFSASIESIAKSFVNSQFKLEPLAELFGETHFGRLSRLILGAFEGFLFGGFTVFGIELFSRVKEKSD